MIIYVVLSTFNITYLAEIMIIVLIIRFVSNIAMESITTRRKEDKND